MMYVSKVDYKEKYEKARKQLAVKQKALKAKALKLIESEVRANQLAEELAELKEKVSDLKYNYFLVKIDCYFYA